MFEVNGGCHCGRVRFEAEVDTSKAVECNCTYCHKTGGLLAATGRSQFRITAGEEALTEYRFNKGVLVHQFCSSCGINVSTYGIGPGGSEMAVVNLRCVDGMDLASFERIHFDGLSL